MMLKQESVLLNLLHNFKLKIKLKNLIKYKKTIFGFVIYIYIYVYINVHI